MGTERRASDIEWPIRTEDLAPLLGLKPDSVHSKLSRFRSEFVYGQDYEKRQLLRQRPEVVWHREGAVKLAKRTIRLVKAREFLQDLGEIEREPTSYESRTMDMIEAALTGTTEMNRRYYVRGTPYQVDLFIPGLSIAVECDEHGHAGYPKWEEDYREHQIKTVLNCDILRFDPAKPSDVGAVLNRIIRELMSGPTSAKEGEESSRASK